MEATPLVSVRALTEGDPLGAGGESLMVHRYIVRVPAARETLEYRDVHGARALLPAWKDFRVWFLPRRGRGAQVQGNVPETAALLGHTLSLQWAGKGVPWEAWDDVKVLGLDRELLVGTGRNFRDAEQRRLPQTPERTNYTYVPFVRDEYRVMIDAGINLFWVDAEQSSWVRTEPVFYHRGVGGKAPLAYPAELYRSNYLGPVMFMDEPAIIMVGEKRIHDALRYWSDATNLLMQRVRSRYQSGGNYGAFQLETSLKKAGVAFGEMRLEQHDYPAWETMYATAHYQLAAGLAGIVHEGRYRLAEFDAAVAKWTDRPRKHTAEEMLRYHYAFLRGGARANGGHWGTSIYGQAEAEHSPLAVTLAYDMGARYVWFWTSDHDHHMPWPEQLELARALKKHAKEKPRKTIYGEKQVVDVAVAVPFGYVLELGDLWWVRAIDREGKGEHARRFEKVMREAHRAIEEAMERGESFDVVVDEGREIESYRRVVRVTDRR